MSTLSKTKAGLKITLPRGLADKFSFEDENDIDMEATQDGILLKLSKQAKILKEIKMKEKAGLTKEDMAIAVKAGLIDEDQLYYWTQEWQKSIKKSEEDYKTGRYNESKDLKGFIAGLKE